MNSELFILDFLKGRPVCVLDVIFCKLLALNLQQILSLNKVFHINLSTNLIKLILVTEDS